MSTAQELAHGAGWQGKTELARLEAHLSALEGWQQCRRRAEALVPAQKRTREMRLDESRRREVRGREHRALLERADLQLRATAIPRRRARPQAVVVHRNDWLRGKVAAELAEQQVDVVASVADGAEGAMAVLVEQPDMVFVEDRLPTLDGLQVVERSRQYAPQAVIGVHALAELAVTRLRQAGARAVFARRIPPARIVDGLLSCLYDDRALVTLV